MSNFLAIATVTATLRRILQDAVNAAAAEPGGVVGAGVTSRRPTVSDENSPNRGINIYLYQTTPNAAWRNADLPTRRSDGSLVQQPQVAIDLHYLLSFEGDDQLLEPERLMGLALRTLHARPILTREMIRDTLGDDLFSFLADSDLAEQIELVKLTPLNLSLDDMSKLWSVFFQIPYALSVAYQACTVLVSSEETPQPALPVRLPRVYVRTFRQPAVEQVTAATGRGEPILAGSTLLIAGRNLRGSQTRVRIAGQDVTPQDIRDTEITLALQSLPTGVLRAGVQGLQVVHPEMIGEPPAEHTGNASNVAAFVLHPQIERDETTDEYQITKEDVTGSGDGPYAATLTLIVNPAIGRSQQVALVLNQLAPPGATPAGYRFEAPARDPDTAPETDVSISIPIAGVAAGTYLVRVQVDGAESPLDVDADAYSGPQVVIP